MAESKNQEFFEGVGRRKTSTARVRIRPASSRSIRVNGKEAAEYFQGWELEKVVQEVVDKAHADKEFAVTVLARGGGKRGQAQAVRLGLARALVKYEEGLRGVLGELGFLTRDPRMRERKKFGLKRARRARQWRKR